MGEWENFQRPKKKQIGLGANVGPITYLLEFGRVLHSPSKS